MDITIASGRFSRPGAAVIARAAKVYSTAAAAAAAASILRVREITRAHRAQSRSVRVDCCCCCWLGELKSARGCKRRRERAKAEVGWSFISRAAENWFYPLFRFGSFCDSWGEFREIVLLLILDGVRMF